MYSGEKKNTDKELPLFIKSWSPRWHVRTSAKYPQIIEEYKKFPISPVILSPSLPQIQKVTSFYIKRMEQEDRLFNILRI